MWNVSVRWVNAGDTTKVNKLNDKCIIIINSFINRINMEQMLKINKIPRVLTHTRGPLDISLGLSWSMRHATTKQISTTTKRKENAAVEKHWIEIEFVATREREPGASETMVNVVVRTIYKCRPMTYTYSDSRKLLLLLEFLSSA